MQPRLTRTTLRRLEVAVLLLLSAAAVLFAVASCERGHSEAWKVQCGGNLRIIGTPAMTYADKKGAGWFPLGEGPSPREHESLNAMVAFDPEGISSRLFVCPEGEAHPATEDAEGAFVLDETTCDYAWIAAPTRWTMTERPLSSDKYVRGFRDAAGKRRRGHPGGMNVLYTDNSVRWVRAEDLPEDTGLPAGLTR